MSRRLLPLILLSATVVWGTACANDYADISVASDYSCGIRSDGFLLCWGGNDVFLGLGTGAPSDVPASVGPAQSIHTSTSLACAIDVENRGHCWGDSFWVTEAGERGLPDDLVDEDLTAMAAGNYAACAIHGAEQRLTCFGDTEAYFYESDRPVEPTEPGPVRTPYDNSYTGVDDVTMGFGICALIDGDVECWGGLPSAWAPAETMPTSTAVAVASSNGQVCKVSDGGDLRCAGYDANFLPERTTGVTGLFSGEAAICATYDDDTTECWFVTGNTNAVHDDFPSDVVMRDVSTGFDHGCYIDADGQAGCWGEDRSGETTVPWL